MNTIQDIYNKLLQNSITGTEYNPDGHSIIYNTSEYSVEIRQVEKLLKKALYVILTYEGYEHTFIAPDCDNVYNLLSGLYNKEISISRLSDIHIKLKDYSNKKEKRYSKVKAVILGVIGILMGLFSLILCFALPIGSLMFDETVNFDYIAEIPLFLAVVLISISLVKYAILQNRYKKRIGMVVVGYTLIGFFICTSSFMLLEDYDKANVYSMDTIGALCVMLLLVLFGIVCLIFSKRNEGEKSLTLIRDAVLPDTADADEIFRYMEEVCSQGKLSIDELCSKGRECNDYGLDLLMKYSADELSIPIDRTLYFDELMTVLSKDIMDSFDDSNVAKYYYDEH